MKKIENKYKERTQINKRKSLGELEKKKDFILRSKLNKEYNNRIKRIKRIIHNKNNNEYIHRMSKYN